MARPLPKTLLVVFVALGLAWLIVRTVAVGLLATGAPAAVLKLVPGDPVALIASSGYEGSAAKAPTPVQMAMLTQAARRDPLYFQPFLAKAAQVAATGDHRRAIALARAAAARQPRSVPTRLFLLQEYARVGDTRAAVAEMNPVVALTGTSGQALTDTLRLLAADSQGARIIASALRTNPTWRGAFVRSASGAAERLAFQSLVTPPPGVAEANKQDDRSVFLGRLVQNGDYERAYLAWVNFLPATGAVEADAIYDGSFKGLPGLTPFNWSLSSNETATAERRTDSSLPGRTALDVNFFGQDTAQIATETLFVQPGSYLFTMVGVADSGGQFAGRLRWQLACLPRGPVMPLATVAQFTGRPFAVRTPVALPRGCTAQQLSLIGEPGDVSTLLHAQFSGLKLVAR